MTTPPDARIVRRNRIMLVGLFAIAIVPMFGAFWLYESSRSAAPWATTNRGELLDPIVSVGDLHLTVGGRRNVDAQQRSMVVGRRSPHDGCTSECQAAVHQLRQLHILLGRDATRIKRSLVSNSAARRWMHRSRSIRNWCVSPAKRRRCARGSTSSTRWETSCCVTTTASAGKPVLEDMKQLLKVSHIG